MEGQTRINENETNEKKGASSSSNHNNGTFSNIHADLSSNQISEASDALEACISDFFLNNLKMEKTPDTGSISGLFNDPIQLVPGGTSVAWIAAEIDDWIELRIQARDGEV